MELNEYKAWELVDLLKKGEISSRDIADSVFKKIESGKDINGYISILKESALIKADEIDKLYKDKKISDNEAIAGIPVAVKDNICIKDVKTTCGSKILADYKSPYDAFVIKKIEEHKGVIIGKTNMDEFAMGSSTETSFFGPTLNPNNKECIPGGSSGGSASVVADDQAVLSLGSDTGGSIRQPAALCGVVGMKPTYGLVSRYGLVAFASSLDQIGGFSKDVKDMGLLMNVISGYDKKDSTSVDRESVDYYKNIDKFSLKDIKIGLPKEYYIDGVSKEISDKIDGIIKTLKNECALIEDTTLPHTEYAIADYYIIAPSEASSNLARYDGVKYGYRSKEDNLIDMYFKTRGEGFGDEVKRRILIGTYALSSGYYDAYYLKAQKVRTLIKQDFENVFKDYDCLLTPTTPTTAFKIGEKADDPLQMYLFDIFTLSANLSGIPGISIPIGKDSKGLPIGLQLLGKHFDEKRLLQIAYAIEQII